MRERLRKADELLREGRVAEALALYDAIADEFERTGLSLKAVAVSRQIVEITGRDVVGAADLRTAALRRLVRLFTGLGLPADAAETERLLHASQGRLQ